MLFKTLPALSFAAMAVFSGQASAGEGLGVEACKLYMHLTLDAFKARKGGMTKRAALADVESVPNEGIRNMAWLAASRAYAAPLDIYLPDLANQAYNGCQDGTL